MQGIAVGVNGSYHLFLRSLICNHEFINLRYDLDERGAVAGRRREADRLSLYTWDEQKPSRLIYSEGRKRCIIRMPVYGQVFVLWRICCRLYALGRLIGSITTSIRRRGLSRKRALLCESSSIPNILLYTEYRLSGYRTLPKWANATLIS